MSEKYTSSLTAYNRAYLASVLRTSAQIPLWETSDTLGTLYESARMRRGL